MPLVILDRDGVINVDSSSYIKSAKEWVPIPGSLEAISMLSQAGFHIYIATNQAGLSRKLFNLDDLTSMHNKLEAMLSDIGGTITRIYFCPHHPLANCLCRKPGTGLLEKIAAHSRESLKGQPFVGDSLKDIQAATSMGCEPILVKTGNGLKTQKLIDQDIKVFDNLYAFAVSYIKYPTK
ncbi:MAG: D-glycero-beta-D-manno-heptose 1,7-bisphosphate 7-phosphatase [Pseudomonadales bacterium]|nr:D-glycero-beta-D-manno-heptose 1,7-bisphosphate 7-phosphatase [Pseudomonadales bacterium]